MGQHLKFISSLYGQVKLTYDYKYMDHVTGEEVAMSHVEPPPIDDTVFAFDGLYICTGTNYWPSQPIFKVKLKTRPELRIEDSFKAR